MFENCVEIRSQFSDYLDGACSRESVISVRFHLTHCVSCRKEIELARGIQADLRSMPVRHAPPEATLRLRVALSQHLHQNLMGRVAVFLENAIKPLMLPASAGVLTAMLCFGLILGSQVVPVAEVGSAPLETSTPPRVRALGPINFSIDEQGVVLMTHVDSVGRVIDYQVLSGQESPALMERLDRLMYSSYFQPATMFGKPTDGQLVLSLRRITVRG
jgi:hypothetical protein